MKKQPKVMISRDDYRRLNAMLDNMPPSDAVMRLIDELERADIVDPEKMPKNVVMMNSTVTFTVLSTSSTFTYTLVYPQQAGAENTLSVMTPVGSALLGLSIGQEMEWPLPDGKTTRVRIDALVG